MGPERYGHDPIDALGEVNPLRDEFEGRLIRMAAEMKMPVLGICRGIQSMNVAMGGTLWQDVPSQYRTADGEKGIAHSQSRSDFYTSHRVCIENAITNGIVATDDCMLAESYGQKVKLVETGKENIKITYKEDIEIAEAILTVKGEVTEE